MDIDIKKYGVRYYLDMANKLADINTFTAQVKANYIYEKINEYNTKIKEA